MPQIGPLEILVVLAVALVVFGPEKLPGMLRQVGKAAGELRRMASDVKDEFDTGLNDDDEAPQPALPEKALRLEDEGPPEPAKDVPPDPDSQER